MKLTFKYILYRQFEGFWQNTRSFQKGYLCFEWCCFESIMLSERCKNVTFLTDWNIKGSHHQIAKIKGLLNLIMWLRDYVIMWLCDYVIVWLCDCVIVWLCDCVIVWLCDCVIVWLCDYVIMWLCDYVINVINVINVIMWLCDYVIMWLCGKLSNQNLLK